MKLANYVVSTILVIIAFFVALVLTVLLYTLEYLLFVWNKITIFVKNKNGKKSKRSRRRIIPD